MAWTLYIYTCDQQPKARIYYYIKPALLCPRLLWDFGIDISDLPMSWVTKCLEATATRFFKKWSGLPHPRIHPAPYLPMGNGGMNLTNISMLYRRMKTSIACQLITSCDPITQQVSKNQTQREESQKRAKFQPMLKAWVVMAADPFAKHHVFMKCAKNLGGRGYGREIGPCQVTKCARSSIVDDTAASRN